MHPERPVLQAHLTPILRERSAETGSAIVLVLEDDATFERMAGRPRRFIESLLEVCLTTLAVGDGFELTAELHTPSSPVRDGELSAALVLAAERPDAVVIDLEVTGDAGTHWIGRHSSTVRPEFGSLALRTVLA